MNETETPAPPTFDELETIATIVWPWRTGKAERSFVISVVGTPEGNRRIRISFRGNEVSASTLRRYVDLPVEHCDAIADALKRARVRADEMRDESRAAAEARRQTRVSMRADGAAPWGTWQPPKERGR